MAVPTVDQDACIACGVCADACPSEAIAVEDYAVVDADKCVECGSCIDECPVEALSA